MSETPWLAKAKRLQAIASTGLSFCKDEFDRERYEEIAAIANAMLADLADVPVERIRDLVSDFAKGYATPKIDVRAALVENNKILLVREKSDGLWTLPGGFADVGLSASENVVKEVQEEAGIAVSVHQLYSVRHKAKSSYEPDARDFYKMFFLCRRTGALTLTSGLETSEVSFFERDRLPPLSRSRSIERDVELAFEFNDGRQTIAVID
ncbi:NUDIX hydrolase [Rhizobium leguminosarum]|uniref:NUDIX hydrolase n=1 Tax=Rhizobium leguminosarum TaxID=384 RepID=UPI00144143D9|nr:NUDIX hydrolase [Rhizobium leguminosarum]NKJ77797.1 NUDIX domain-containing protein [Rhizobium leguminosarum bv. viciae]